MIRLTITGTGEELGIFADLKAADEWHDNWAEQFGYDEWGSLAPSCTFAAWSDPHHAWKIVGKPPIGGVVVL